MNGPRGPEAFSSSEFVGTNEMCFDESFSLLSLFTANT